MEQTDTVGKSAVEPLFGPGGYLGTRGGHEETAPTAVQRLIPGKISRPSLSSGTN